MIVGAALALSTEAQRYAAAAVTIEQAVRREYTPGRNQRVSARLDALMSGDAGVDSIVRESLDVDLRDVRRRLLDSLKPIVCDWINAR